MIQSRCMPGIRTFGRWGRMVLAVALLAWGGALASVASAGTESAFESAVSLQVIAAAGGGVDVRWSRESGGPLLMVDMS